MIYFKEIKHHGGASLNVIKIQELFNNEGFRTRLC
jgi:hypothetical protein